MKYFVLLACFSFVYSSELTKIFNTPPNTAIIPYYGDKALYALNKILRHEQNTFSAYFNIITQDEIKETKALPTDKLDLLEKLMPHITAQRKATIFYSTITISLIFGLLGMWELEILACGTDSYQCEYYFDKTIPAAVATLTAPFFFYRFWLQPDIAEFENNCANLFEKLRT
jgi:hypothetical protein